jgi:hypothetical protein
MIYEYAEPWWNDMDREGTMNLEKNPSQSLFVHQKSYMD